MTDSLKTLSDTLIYNSKISNLNPIIVSDPIKFEFATPGWYLVLFLLLVAIFFVIKHYYKVYKGNRLRRETIKHLKDLKSDIAIVTNENIIDQVSCLLKLVSFKSYGRRVTAQLSGKKWHDFLLDKIKKRNKDISFELITEHYKFKSEKVTEERIIKLIDSSIIWVRSHHV
jgi:hypothetical protein